MRCKRGSFPDTVKFDFRTEIFFQLYIFFMKISGNLPISDAAEIRKMERMKKKTSSIEEVSSYLLMTEAAQVIIKK